MKQKSDGEAKIELCRRAADATLAGTAHSGRVAIQAELDELTTVWDSYQQTLDKHFASLKEVLAKWDTYGSQYDSLSLWIKDMERKAKDVTLGASLEEKKSKANKLQVSQLTEYPLLGLFVINLCMLYNLPGVVS